MSTKKNLTKQNTYNKHNSFFSFSSINKEFNEDKITKKINNLHKNKIGLERINAKDHLILDTAVNDLNLNTNEKSTSYRSRWFYWLAFNRNASKKRL